MRCARSGNCGSIGGISREEKQMGKSRGRAKNAGIDLDLIDNHRPSIPSSTYPRTTSGGVTCLGTGMWPSTGGG